MWKWHILDSFKKKVKKLKEMFNTQSIGAKYSIPVGLSVYDVMYYIWLCITC